MITKLKQLWMQAFGDSRESIDAFFATGYKQENSAAICRDGQPVSALYWLDYTWKTHKLAYIYAVATEEKFRGQGFGRKLMEKAHAALQERGYAGAVLVPAEQHLVSWYEKQGYQTFCRANKQEISAGTAVPVAEISPEEYAALRQKIKPDAPQPAEELYKYFATYGSFYKAEDCIFAVSRRKDTAYFQEFLGDSQKLPNLVGGLDAKTGVARIAAPGEPFAMYYPLTQSQMPDYFSFALD